MAPSAGDRRTHAGDRQVDGRPRPGDLQHDCQSICRLALGTLHAGVNGDGTTTLYLHVFDWPTDGKLIVPQPSGSLTGARLMEDQQELTTTSSDAGLTIQIPAVLPTRT